MPNTYPNSRDSLTSILGNFGCVSNDILCTIPVFWWPQRVYPIGIWSEKIRLKKFLLMYILYWYLAIWISACPLDSNQATGYLGPESGHLAIWASGYLDHHEVNKYDWPRFWFRISEFIWHIYGHLIVCSSQIQEKKVGLVFLLSTNFFIIHNASS